MKLKLKQEITNSTPEELKKRLLDSRKAFQQAMLDHKQFKLKNTSSLTTKRHEIAVILTVIKEKEAQNHGQNA
ncbi:MAG: uL29 family ribosomal protein [Patescibacteria group bacterium]